MNDDKKLQCPVAKSNDLYSIGLVTIVIVISYISAFSADFVCDDIPAIVDNYKIHSLQYLPGYFSAGVWQNSAVEMKDSFLYRPFFLLFLAINYKLWGTNPLGFHVLNITLHVVNAAMVFFIIKEVVPRKEVNYPFWGSLLFAVHPIHVESVAWISGSTDLLLTSFFSAAFLSFLRYRRGSDYRWFLVTVAFFTGALLSKEPAVVFPLLVFAWDFSQDRKVYPRRLAVLCAVTALYLLLRSSAIGGTLGTLHIHSAGFSRLAEFVAGYLKLLVVPWPLSFYFKAPSIGAMDIVLAVVFFIIMVWIAVKDRRALFYLMWFFVTLAPSLSLAFHTNPTFAERFTYLPSIGFIIFLIYALQLFKVHRKVLVTGLSAVIALYSVLCFVAVGDWQNDEVFYTKLTKTNPDVVSGYQGLAKYYERKERYEESIAYHMRSLELSENAKIKTSIHDSLGRLYGISGITEESIRHYEQVLAIAPNDSMAHVGIGNNYLMRKEYGRALVYYAKAYEIDANNYEACYNIALVHEALAEYRLAEHYYRAFLKSAPEEKYGAVKVSVRKRYPALE